MAAKNPLDELRDRVSELLNSASATTPARDLEKNFHVLLASFFDRFELASRDDLDVQKKLLERAQTRLAALEARVAELESRKPAA